jgi:nicotinamidase-related amidase
MKALVLIDIQNDYFPGGKMGLVGSEQAGKNAGRLLAAFRRNKAPVFHVRHISVHPGATFFLPDTAGAGIHASVQPVDGEIVITKHYPNAFRETTLLRQLREAGADTLVFAGMMTHMCIDTAIRAAFDLGFTCVVAHDACATLDLAFGGKTVPADSVQTACMATLGWMFAKVEDTERVVNSFSDIK